MKPLLVVIKLIVKQKSAKELSVSVTYNISMKVFIQIVSRLLKIPKQRLTLLDSKNMMVDETKTLNYYLPTKGFIVEVKPPSLAVEKTPSYLLINNTKIRNLLLLYMTREEKILIHIWSLFKLFPIDQDLQGKLLSFKIKESETPENELATYFGVDQSVPNQLYFFRALNKIEGIDYDLYVKHYIFKLFISILLSLTLDFVPSFSYLKTLTYLFKALARFIQTYRNYHKQIDDLEIITNMALGIIYPINYFDNTDPLIQHLYVKLARSIFEYAYNLSLTGKDSLDTFKKNDKFTSFIRDCILPYI